MLGLITLFGGFAISVRAGARVRAATRPEEVRTWVRLLQSAAPMFPAGLGLLLLSGLYMMISRWRAPHPWILVGLVGLVVIGVVGGGVGGRRINAMSKAAAVESGDVSPERVSELIADPLTWIVMAALNGLALGIVWVMSTKPGWTGSIVAAAAGTTLGPAVGYLRRRRASRSPLLRS
jgi:uncharacterized membrane protein